jgi:hypothetical protein
MLSLWRASVARTTLSRPAGLVIWLHVVAQESELNLVDDMDDQQQRVDFVG